MSAKWPRNQRSPSLDNSERTPLVGIAAANNHDTSMSSNWAANSRKAICGRYFFNSQFSISPAVILISPDIFQISPEVFQISPIVILITPRQVQDYQYRGYGVPRHELPNAWHSRLRHPERVYALTRSDASPDSSHQKACLVTS